MNDIQLFDNPEFGSVRALAAEDGTELFCAKDVAQALGYKNTQDAIGKHCHGVAKRYPIVDQLGRTQEARFITEPDVFRLIVGSKLPSAQRFEAWLFEEVLPAIRKRGAYVADIPGETTEELLARALLAANDAMERQKQRMGSLEKENAQMRPKALFADAVSTSDSCMLIGQFAKVLRQNGVAGMGQNRLFAWMRENGYLGKSGSNRNVPLQKYIEQGLFRVKETAITHSDGHVSVNLTTKLTGKGQTYFAQKFLGAGQTVMEL